MKQTKKKDRKPIKLSPHFMSNEAQCKCPYHDCKALIFPPVIVVNKIEKVRKALGEPIIINSWIRCPRWNKNIGGKPESNHLLGIAIDIKTNHQDRHYRWRLVLALMAHGFSVIIYKTFVHADLRPGNPILLLETEI